MKQINFTGSFVFYGLTMLFIETKIHKKRHRIGHNKD